MIRLFILALILCFAAPAMAADPAGLWAMRVGKTTLFELDIRRDGVGWAGTWIRSAGFDVDADGKIKTGGAGIRRAANTAHANPDGSVELSFDDPRPGATPDVFRIHPIDATHAETYYNGGRMGAIVLLRVPASTPLDAKGPARSFTYASDNDWPTNAEMTAIFTADQGDRHAARIDWSVVGPADEKRRIRTQQLLDAGALHSGDDFLHAAFVFQHGSNSDAFLKAHILATVAIARGNPGAIWIAAATLDRYLKSIGQPQVAGTQFSGRDGKWTQDPYDRALISDALRQALNVPPLDEQEAQRKRYEAASKN